MSDTPGIRIDKWLWAARFFKTRSKARLAIQGGKVHLHGKRIKPSRALSEGDVLRIQRGDEELTVTVEVLSDRRGPAVEAQKLYVESAQSIAQREQQREQKALQKAASGERERRPDKRGRRQIIRFIKKGE